MNIVKSLILNVLLFTPVVSNASLLYTSTFADNGNLVTETRQYDGYTETWEWLDLTITNGITYLSIAADLADNGNLDNSFGLVGNENSIADVTGLSATNTSGWSTVSDQEVVDLFNHFFSEVSLIDDQMLRLGVNNYQVEVFILMFGDTYHEGRDDFGFFSKDNNKLLPNIGYTFGLTNSAYGVDSTEGAMVNDGQYDTSTVDNIYDYLETNQVLGTSSTYPTVGTWLTRQVSSAETQVTQIPEPGTFVLFSLAMIGMISGQTRRRLLR